MTKILKFIYVVIAFISLFFVVSAMNFGKHFRSSISNFIFTFFKSIIYLYFIFSLSLTLL
jgi:hypothetical protein